MTGIMQVMLGGSFGPPPPPTTIGQSYGGGFYAGKIAVGGGGIATHYLVVAPKETGESFVQWGVNDVSTGAASVINGPANTSSLVALGAAYQAAVFCNNLNSSGGLNGYTDWYLPAKNELEVCYYNLKPYTAPNNTSSGANANAVFPEPINTNYTSGSPAQTSAGIGFRYNETNAFARDYYWSSTEIYYSGALAQGFEQGNQITLDKSVNSHYVRAVRRVPV
jgi:hypothetical protein